MDNKLFSTFRALKHRNYRLYFIGQLASLTGTWMQNVAQSWLVYRLSHSPILLGAMTFANQIPAFLLAPIGGACADRFNKRYLLLVTQTAAMLLALGLGGLIFADLVKIPYLFVFTALLGIVNAFDMPTRHSFVIELVGKEDLANAIALNSAMFNSARTIGPAIAGILVATIGEGWCFLINAASFLAVIVALLFMDTKNLPRLATTRSALAEILDGFRFTVGNPPLRNMMTLLVVNSVFGLLYAVLMPIFSDKILDGGVRGLGMLMASAGIGTLFGSLMLATRRSAHGLERWISGSGWGYGAALVLFAWSKTFWLSAVFLFPIGFFQVVQWSASNTLIQAIIPDELRGRVMALYIMTFVGGGPLGALFGGWMANRIGAPLTVSVSGIACITGATLFALRFKMQEDKDKKPDLTNTLSRKVASYTE
ncbi:MAG: MFS transporter [Candidatus Riflebacteria bacterium]|nr:MFS transporter [Candidatus Riflebacteria bacterium]